MNKGTVKKVTSNGTYKEMFSFEYELEIEGGDELILNVNHKENKARFKEGDVVEYKIDFEKGDWKKGSLSFPDQGNNYSSQSKRSPVKNDDYIKGIEVGHAVNNSVNMMCAGVELEKWEEGMSNEEKIYVGAKVIMQISNRLKNE